MMKKVYKNDTSNQEEYSIWVSPSAAGSGSSRSFSMLYELSQLKMMME
jgi:hypothetical protein